VPADRLLDDLDEYQRAAVTSPHVPLAIIAPAGAGKTRVLTRRIAFRIREGDAAARHVLALTFTRKAAGELVDRLHRLGIDGMLTAGTFHATALAQLRRYAAERGWDPPHVLDRKARVLAPLVGGHGPSVGVAINAVAAEIEWAKARLVTPETFADAAARAGRRLPRPAPELAELYLGYERELRKRRVLDFDDVLGRCTDTIRRDDDFAAAQRWRFRHLFVDEFQDATPLQLRVLRAWLGTNPDLTVVGDPAQAIYGFAGADAAALREFDRAFPGGTTIPLVYNYRSTPGVVTVAEAALASRRGPSPRAVRGPGARPTFVAYADDQLEAADVADRCWRLFRDGVPWGDIGVLSRTNAQSARFEAAFTRRNVPFCVADERRFAARAPVRVLLDLMRTSERAAPERAFSEHLSDLAILPSDRDELNTDDVLEHRDALLEFGRAYVAAEDGPGCVASFTSWLDATTRGDAARRSGVELATFHRAKGLEWPVVFVTGLERGLVPISWATAPADVEEERRLLHVACSRAGDELHCSWARARTVNARVVSRDPSPWLGALEHAASSLPGPDLDLAGHLAELRTTLAHASPPAEKPRPRPSRPRIR
jgi:DNA helicase-2/ATP-dependent DNA helicase PcrA